MELKTTDYFVAKGLKEVNGIQVKSLRDWSDVNIIVYGSLVFITKLFYNTQLKEEQKKDCSLESI